MHYYANKNNRFWKNLFKAGIIDRQYKPEEKASLLKQGIGFTNIVARPTKALDEIACDEYRIGRETLRHKNSKYQPKVTFLQEKVFIFNTVKEKGLNGKTRTRRY